MIEEIAGYSIKKLIGVGGMSKVYLARDNKLKRHVAIKVLSPSYAKEKRVTKRFIKEARTAAQLQHSNIISIYDVGKENKYYYIAMEYLRVSLKDKIKRGNLKNDPEAILKIIKDTAAALSYAHKRGFIHRDIKPDNIMFRNDGTLVLVDFGIVKALKSDSNLTRTGISIGTPRYMSPEQMRAKKIDSRSDIYSLGIVLYELFTGSTPYKDTDLVMLAIKHAKGPIPELSKKYNYIQPLLNKMLAKNPGERVKDCDGLIRLTDALLHRINTNKTGSLKKYQKETKEVKTGKSKTAKSILFILFTVLIAVLILISSLVVLTKVSNIKKEESLWESVKHENTESSLKKYLELYPKGKYSILAGDMIQNFMISQRIFESALRNSEKMYDQGKYKEALENIKEAKKIKITPALKQLEKKILEKLN
ncbi:MAG: serine/threonine-protein kinase [Acidobacteriota bacterium]